MDPSPEQDTPNLRYISIVDKSQPIEIIASTWGEEYQDFKTKPMVIPSLGELYFYGMKDPERDLDPTDPPSVYLTDQGAVFGKQSQFKDKFRVSLWMKYPGNADVTSEINAYLKFPNLNKKIRTVLDFDFEAIGTCWQDENGTRYKIYSDPNPDTLSKIQLAFTGETETSEI